MIQIWCEDTGYFVTPTECSIAAMIYSGANTEYMKTLRDLILHGY